MGSQQHCVEIKTSKHQNMEVGNIDQWPEFRREKYQLPNIIYHKGSYYLDSSAQLTSMLASSQEKTYRSRIFWDYLPRDPPVAANQALPSAKNITSLSYIGGRHQHPSLRQR